MLQKQTTVKINELAELIRSKYGYQSVLIDHIWAGITSGNMRYIELGPSAILNVHILVSEKATKDTIMVITKADTKLSIEILNPQPASMGNDNISDADFALRTLQEWDNETAFILRENMELVSETLKAEPIKGIEGTTKPFKEKKE